MNIYDFWIYRQILNTEWFLWGIIGSVFFFNMFALVAFWFSLTEKKWQFKPKKLIDKITKKQNTS